MSEFRGVVPAIITPFTPTGDFNEQAYRRVMEANIEAGAHGFWIAGGTGESVLLSAEEIVTIAEVSADQGRGRVKNIVHVGSLTTKQSVSLAKDVARAGADAICCVPPFFYTPNDETLVDYYKAVAEATDLPFFIYNLPQSTGTEITLELMEKLVESVPQLAGVKHSAANFHNIYGFSALGIATFCGSGSLLLPALTVGAVGGIDGPLNIAPELWVRVYESYLAGDIAQAQEAQEQATKLVDLVRRYGLHGTVKLLISTRLGIDCGEPRPPIPSLSSEDTDQILARWEELATVPVGR